MRTRFAPSPTGPLHLGHAFSAFTARDVADTNGGEFLLRIEDIDLSRARASWEAGIFDDLDWLGLHWPEPVMRQSTRLHAYRDALQSLWAMGLLYRCSCTRRDIARAASAPQEEPPKYGPDGLVYPGICRGNPRTGPIPEGVLRLDIVRAVEHLGDEIGFEETGPERHGVHRADAMYFGRSVGDVVLARRDLGTSYHLAVVVDDAAQGITHVVRGEDLFEASFVHTLLQRLLQQPVPIYYHHRLIRDEAGRRLAKRDDARAISTYREAGAEPEDIRRMVGL